MVRTAGKKEVLEMSYDLLPSDPSLPQEGDFYYNSTSKRFRLFDGTSFVEL